jgi:hypothetical protein
LHSLANAFCQQQKNATILCEEVHIRDAWSRAQVLVAHVASFLADSDCLGALLNLLYLNNFLRLQYPKTWHFGLEYLSAYQFTSTLHNAKLVLKELCEHGAFWLSTPSSTNHRLRHRHENYLIPFEVLCELSSTELIF